MDRITLQFGKTQKTYESRFAADVPGSNRFSALILGGLLPEIITDFLGADVITVENPDTGTHTYIGYTTFVSLQRWEDGHLLILERGDES